jgi:hypothetical protein
MLNPGVLPPVTPPTRPAPPAGTPRPAPAPTVSGRPAPVPPTATTRPAPVPAVPGRPAPVPPTTRPGQPTTSFRPNFPPGSIPRTPQEQLGHWLNVPTQRNWPGANRGAFVTDRWENWHHPGNFNAFAQARGNHVRNFVVNNFAVNHFNQFFTPDWFRVAHHHGFFFNFRPPFPWFWWNFATAASLLIGSPGAA